jgi:hypothetical protein
MDQQQTTIRDFQMLPAIQDPAIDFRAALYFLDGTFLFRSRDNGAWSSKFVTIADVQAAFTGTEQDSGWLPAGIVRAGSSASGKWFVYSAPAQKATITFDGEAEQIRIPLPRTVLVGVGANYYLWTTASAHFDSSATACAAPFPNVHSDGRICWGASTPPRANPEKARLVWDLFFSTPFNGHLVDRKSKAFPADVHLQLRELAGKKEYPVNDLVSTQAAIKYLVDRVIKG